MEDDIHIVFRIKVFHEFCYTNSRDMVQSLQHMHLNGFVTFGLQTNTVEKLTCFEYYFDVICDI